jgi:hypothetical protein
MFSTAAHTQILGQQKSADVQLLVYTVYTVYTLYTVCTHMPNVYNFVAGTAVYRTAVPHECTMHGGNRHPGLDLE